MAELVQAKEKTMKFGVNSFIWSSSFDRSCLPLLDAVRTHGFDGIELPLINPGDLQDPVIAAALAASGLECTICSVLPPELSIVTEDTTVRQKTLEHMRQCIETAARLGARIIAGPLYTPVGYLPGRRRTSQEWDRAVEFYRSIGTMLDAYDVTIAIEPLNRFETYFLNTVSDAVALCDEIAHRKVGILFDTFHANIEEKNIPSACRACGEHLRHVHTSENDRGIPGTGHVDWQGLFAVLNEMGYNGWLTIESFGFSLGALSAAASIWRDLAPTAEAIAFDGIQFLKQAASKHFLTNIGAV